MLQMCINCGPTKAYVMRVQKHVICEGDKYIDLLVK